jgi:hypothetical protein
MSAAVVLFAFYGNHRSVSADEVWSLKTVGLNPRAMIEILRADVHPPLYFLLLAGWSRLFGATEAAARSLSGILYIAAASALFGLVRSFWDRRTAVLAAAIYLSSPLALLAAHFARMYALVSLLAIVSTWAYLRLWNGPSRRACVVLVTVNALGSFTHLWFFFLLLAEGLCALPGRRRVARIWVMLAASVVPFALLWSPALVIQLRHSGDTMAWVPRPGLFMVGQTLFLYCGVLLVFAPAVAWFYCRRRPAECAAPSALFWLPPVMLLITIGAPLIISFWRPLFWSRFAIVALHLFAIIAAHVGARAIRGNQLAAAVLTVGLASFLYLSQGDSRCEARPGAEYIAHTARPGDWVVYSSLSRAPIDYYLAGQSTAPMNQTSFPPEIDAHPGYEGPLENPARRATLEHEADQLLDRIAASPPGRVFLMHGFRPKVDGILLRKLESRFTRLDAACVRCAEMGSYYDRISVYEHGRRGPERLDIQADGPHQLERVAVLHHARL